MAVGFAVTLSGALISILPIPGAQAIGGSMIGIGGGMFLEGLALGEMPYYVDSETGQRLDP